MPLSQPPVPDAAPTDAQVDVVVVGAGACGIVAGLRALEAGAEVNHANGNEGSALKIAVARGHREVALVLVEHGASNNTLTQPMLKTLYEWTAETLKQNKKVIAENSKQMEEMVQGIPEWCAQAASTVAAEGQNNGISSSSAPDDAQPQPEGVGRKRKAPYSAE